MALTRKRRAHSSRWNRPLQTVLRRYVIPHQLAIFKLIQSSLVIPKFGPDRLTRQLELASGPLTPPRCQC
jgi:hypothetical protein